MITKINWLSQENAVRMTPTKNQAMISITNPDADLAQLHPSWKNLIRLQFDDSDREGQRLFNIRDAQTIVEFVERLEYCEEEYELYIHCEHGVSRSAGVALAISDMYYIPEMIKGYSLYNRHVYKLVCLASRRLTSEY